MHIHVCLHGNTHTCTCSPCVPTQHSTCLVVEGTPYNCHTNEFLRNPEQRERGRGIMLGTNVSSLVARQSHQQPAVANWVTPDLSVINNCMA